jgi:hypothetical protein
MDKKIKKYQKAILKILTEYAQLKYANVEGANHLVADKERHHYQIMTVGWQKNKYIHDCPMHFDIIDGKIWIQHNMTEWNVGEMLEAEKVPKSDIVLGFLLPSTRVYSDYAVA